LHQHKWGEKAEGSATRAKWKTHQTTQHESQPGKKTLTQMDVYGERSKHEGQRKIPDTWLGNQRKKPLFTTTDQTMEGSCGVVGLGPALDAHSSCEATGTQAVVRGEVMTGDQPKANCFREE